MFSKAANVKDLREEGRVILAHGEVTGHCHEVVEERAGEHDIPAMDYFEEPDTGRRVLLVTRPCVLRHQEHAPIALSPEAPIQVRQGDVLLNPIGLGAWEVIRQREDAGESSQQVLD